MQTPRKVPYIGPRSRRLDEISGLSGGGARYCGMPRWVDSFLISLGSRISANIFIPDPQLGHRNGSITDYPNAKIVLNQAVIKDLNFRVFEAMSAGAMLLTPQVS